jgi:hypothetical protein
MSESNSSESGSLTGELSTSRAETGKAGTRAPQAPFEVSQEPLLPGGTAHEPPMGSYSPVPAYEHLGDLPPTYGSQSVYLVAYDPRQLFAYWDVDPAAGGASHYGLRVCRGDGEVESETAINPREAGRYLATGVPGGTYYVELGTTGRTGRWRPLAFSGRVTMPAAGLAGEVEPKFATLPFHLSFQRLMELIQDAMEQGEDLAAALARLQGGDQRGLESLVNTLASLSREQMRTLERLLGHQVSPRGDVASSFQGGSESFVVAGAPGAGEQLSSGALSGGAASSGAFGSEVLSSRAAASETAAAGAFGSQTLSSQEFARGESLTSGAAGLGSETLVSGAALGSETLVSGSALGSETLVSGALLGSETLASGAASLGSETLASGIGLGGETLTSGVGLGSETLVSGALLGSETLASGAAGFGSETLGSGSLEFGSETLASGAVGFGSETLGSETLGFGSEFSSLGLSQSSIEILLALGINSEAWSLASGQAGLSSEALASDVAARFFHGLEASLTELTSMFSLVAAGLDSESMNSESVSSSGSGSL